MSPNELIERGICYCGGKIIRVSKTRWVCNRCGFEIIEKR